MTLTLARITVASPSYSLRQVVSQGPLVLRTDSSGPALLVDLSGKKPVCRTVPTGTIEGTNLAISWVSGALSPDGAQFALLGDGDNGKVLRVERFTSATAEPVAGFDVDRKLEKPYGVQYHPDGQRLLVYGVAEVLVCSLDGKVQSRAPGRSMSVSPDGTRAAVQLDDERWAVRAFGGKKDLASFKADEVTWADDQRIVCSDGTNTDDHSVSVVDPASGKKKKLGLVPHVKSLDACAGRVFTGHWVEKKNVVHVLSLEGEKPQVFELAGRASEICVCAAPEGGFVSVNWQKTLHVFTAAAAKKKQPAAKKPTKR